MYNSNADKKLKGIEIPQGDISFDVELSEVLGADKHKPEGTDYSPVLWDYWESDFPNRKPTTGKLGREMYIGGPGSVSPFYDAAPYTKYSNPDTYNTDWQEARGHCYDGGTIQITDSGGGILHVTISGYLFDEKEFQFPTNNVYQDKAVYGENIGCFSAGYFQIICQFPDEVMEDTDLYFSVGVKNLKANSLSGKASNEDVCSEDDISSMKVTLTPKGSYVKDNYFWDDEGEWPDIKIYLSSNSETGDAYAFPGQHIRIASKVTFSGDVSLRHMNILQKFDDKAFEIENGATPVFKCSSNPVNLNCKFLYAAKPDKQGWTDDLEMNTTKEEALVYFNSIEALHSAGYTCVGILYEIRDSALTPQMYLGSLPAKVKLTAEIGSVYQTVNDVRLWDGNDKVMSWTEVNPNGDMCGLGNGESGLYSGFRKPLVVLYNEPPFKNSPYYKSVYENGGIVDGHTGGCQAGNSLLIIGCKTGISSQVKDNKDTFDLDKGERTVDFLLHVSVDPDTENRDVLETDDTTDVKVTVTLPPGCSYVEGSGEPAPYDVKVNPDGSTTITWLLEDQKVGEPVPDIHFQCSLDESVKNGDSLTVKTGISSDKDERAQIPEFGNYSESTVKAVQLAESSVQKTVDSAFVDMGDGFSYTLHYSNNADTATSGAHIFDILPYNNDDRGSNYHGGFQLDTISFDFTEAPTTFQTLKDSLSVFVTTSEEVRTTATAETIVTNGTSSAPSVSWQELTNGTITGSTITWSSIGIDNAAGIYVNFDVIHPHEYIPTHVTLKPVNAGEDKQLPADSYANDFMESSSNYDVPIKSNSVDVQVTDRSISGLAWMDEDQDGIRKDEEEKISNLTASLYRTTVSSFDSEGNDTISIGGKTLYPAYDFFGVKVDPVKADSGGAYSFSNLEAGAYYVVFSDAKSFTLTAQNAGESDAVDSDAGASDDVYYIGEISLPTVEEMHSYKYESVNNDIGLYMSSVILPETGGPGNRILLLFSLLFLLAGGGLVVVLKKTEGKM